MSRKIFGEADVERMRHLYVEEERTAPEIGHIMHCKGSTVRAYLRAAGVQLRPRGGSRPRVSHREMELIQFLYWQQGWTIEQLADYLHVHRHTIRGHMDRYGIPCRTKSQIMRIRWQQQERQERQEQERQERQERQQLRQERQERQGRQQRQQLPQREKIAA